MADEAPRKVCKVAAKGCRGNEPDPEPPSAMGAPRAPGWPGSVRGLARLPRADPGEKRAGPLPGPARVEVGWPGGAGSVDSGSIAIVILSTVIPIVCVFLYVLNIFTLDRAF